MRLIYFTASWADAICSPHRTEVAAAAHTLGLPITEIDVDDELAHELVRAYKVLNVPVVGLEVDGQRAGRLIGAHPASVIVATFEPLIAA